MTARASSPQWDRASSPRGPGRAYELRRAGDNWLNEGRSQGWSHRTLSDRRYTLNRFYWWLETEAEAPLSDDLAHAGEFERV